MTAASLLNKSNFRAGKISYGFTDDGESIRTFNYQLTREQALLHAAQLLTMATSPECSENGEGMLVTVSMKVKGTNGVASVLANLLESRQEGVKPVIDRARKIMKSGNAGGSLGDMVDLSADLMDAAEEAQRKSVESTGDYTNIEDMLADLVEENSLLT